MVTDKESDGDGQGKRWGMKETRCEEGKVAISMVSMVDEWRWCGHDLM